MSAINWEQKEIKGFSSVEMLSLFCPLELEQLAKKKLPYLVLIGTPCRPNYVVCYLTNDVSPDDGDDIMLLKGAICHYQRERKSYTKHIKWKPGYRLSSTSTNELIPWDIGDFLFLFLLFMHKSLRTLQQC